ncbi:MAG: MATE family efflux transporter [Oscillospiraceae bacterium]|nr:MATE family efflux transporter [Oscillospiraceae bacterium]
MASQGTMDLTQGRPIRQILLFSLPLVAGTLFQQLYSFVDTAMVGRLIGENALAAVGTTYSLNFVVLGFVQGACVGFGIPLAQSMGAKDAEAFKRYFWNGIWLCTILSAVMTAGTFVLADPLLRLIQTPAEILGDATRYIQVIFLGIPATILYNFCAGALRAAGDSRRPTIFLLATCALNILLDYLFIAPLGMGVAGAALATVISQGLSGLLNLLWMVFKTDLLNDCGGLRGFSVPHAGKLCRIGLPMGFEYCVSGLGAVIMQSAINSLGTAAIAGQTCGEKIRQMFTLPMESVGMGIATYAGQNDGARRYDRIKQGIGAGLVIQWSYCIAAWIVIYFGKGFFTQIVLGPNGGEAAALSVEYLSIISCLFFIHGALMIMRNTLQGMGYSVHAVLSGVGELLGRALGGWMAVKWLGFVGISLANPLAWGLALLYCICMVTHFLRKRLREQEAEAQ